MVPVFRMASSGSSNCTRHSPTANSALKHLSPKEVAQQVLKSTCQFYDADWCGLIQVDLDLSLWTPFWWFNTGTTDKTMILTEEYEWAFSAAEMHAPN